MNFYLPSLWECIINRDFDLITTILKISDENLKEKMTTLSHEYKETLKKCGTFELEEQAEIHFEELLQEYAQLPNILYTSLFLSSYALLEQKMAKLCEEYQTTNKTDIKLKDLNGKGIKKTKLYLRKVAGIAEKDFKNWEKISIYNKIRNCILHNGGIIQDKDLKCLNNFKDKYKVLEINNDNSMELSKKFCEQNFKISNILLTRLGAIIYN